LECHGDLLFSGDVCFGSRPEFELAHTLEETRLSKSCRECALAASRYMLSEIKAFHDRKSRRYIEP